MVYVTCEQTRRTCRHEIYIFLILKKKCVRREFSIKDGGTPIVVWVTLVFETPLQGATPVATVNFGLLGNHTPRQYT